MDGEAVADRLTNTCEAEQREQREAMERSITRDEERIEVLDKMVMRLYEDMVAGRISEQNFNTMLERTQTEQTELKTKVSEGRKRLSDEVQLANDAKQGVEAIFSSRRRHTRSDRDWSSDVCSSDLQSYPHKAA